MIFGEYTNREGSVEFQEAIIKLNSVKNRKVNNADRAIEILAEVIKNVPDESIVVLIGLIFLLLLVFLINLIKIFVHQEQEFITICHDQLQSLNWNIAMKILYLFWHLPEVSYLRDTIQPLLTISSRYWRKRTS